MLVLTALLEAVGKGKGALAEHIWELVSMEGPGC